MDPTILFTHLKIILLQCFQFLVFNKISCIQTDPYTKHLQACRYFLTKLKVQSFFFNFFFNYILFQIQFFKNFIVFFYFFKYNFSFFLKKILLIPSNTLFVLSHSHSLLKFLIQTHLK